MRLKLMILPIFLIGCFAGGAKITTTPIKIESNKNKTVSTTVENLIKFTEDDLIVVTVEGPPAHDFLESGEKQAWINKTVPAPFDGILLNPEAMAYIITEYEALGARANTALKNQREYDVIKLNLETGMEQVAFRAYREKNEIISRGKDDEIKRLKDINKKIIEEAKNPWKKIIVYTTIFAAGAAAGGGLILITK